MMKKVIGLGLVILLVVGMSTLVWAHGSYGLGANGKPGAGLQYNNNRNYQPGGYQARVDLSEQQEEKMEALEEKYEDKIEDDVDELRDKQEKLHDLYFDKEAARKEIVKVQTEINSLQTKLRELNTEYRLDVRDILSTEQLEESAETGRFGMMSFSDFRAHHQGGFGRGMKGGFRGRGPGRMGPCW